MWSKLVDFFFISVIILMLLGTAAINKAQAQPIYSNLINPINHTN